VAKKTEGITNFIKGVWSWESGVRIRVAFTRRETNFGSGFSSISEFYWLSFLNFGCGLDNKFATKVEISREGKC